MLCLFWCLFMPNAWSDHAEYKEYLKGDEYVFVQLFSRDSYDFESSGYYYESGSSPGGVEKESVARKLAEEDCMRRCKDVFVDYVSNSFEDLISDDSYLDFRSKFFLQSIINLADDLCFYNFEFLCYETALYGRCFDDLDILDDLDEFNDYYETARYGHYFDYLDGYKVNVIGGFSMTATFELLINAAELKFEYAYNCEVPESTIELCNVYLKKAFGVSLK